MGSKEELSGQVREESSHVQSQPKSGYQLSDRVQRVKVLTTEKDHSRWHEIWDKIVESGIEQERITKAKEAGLSKNASWDEIALVNEGIHIEYEARGLLEDRALEHERVSTTRDLGLPEDTSWPEIIAAVTDLPDIDGRNNS